jgi:hypothetical protein
MRSIKIFLFLPFFAIFLWIGMANAVQIHQVTQSGRQIQLDGFLLDWQNNAQKLGSDSLWQWDVINTREGLTGYFKTSKPPNCSLWQFAFLPHQLSPYKRINITSNAENKTGIARVNRDSSNTIVIEWIIPWDSISHDSAGLYQVGLFAYDACGDSLAPVIMSGHVFKAIKPLWSGVYAKAVLLGILLVLLFVMQKFTRGKFGKKRKVRK